MILAFDTYYLEDKAKAVCLVFNSWTVSDSTALYEESILGIAECDPGSFYKNKILCILSFLNKIKEEIKSLNAIPG